MEGLILFLFVLCAILLYKLLRQRKALRQLTQQTDRFLEGGEALSVSLKEDDLAALQNSLSRLQNRLLLSQEQTRLEAKRSTRLLTDISHQLKTPLSSLRLFVEMDGGDHLEEEVKLLDKLQTLVCSLLRLERLCADGYAFQFAPQDLRGLVEACWASLEPMYPEKDFRVTGSANLYCDKTWMAEAVTNLLKNACEHTPPTGQIHVTLQETVQEVRCAVSDNGGGVEEADLPLIFERFYQAKGRETTGIGIGLSIVKEIIWRHHGQITARNTRDGLEFSMYFPKLDSILSKS